MEVSAIIQARISSRRLPNKIFALISGKPLIWHVVDRLRRSRKVSRIAVATTTNPADDVLEEWCRENKIEVFRGSEEDVLSRYFHAAKAMGAETIVRVTADDPFKDPAILDEVVELFQKNKLDFAYNNKPPTFPEGLDVEVFSMAALEKAQAESRDQYEREHVTQYFYRHPEKFRQMNLANREDLSRLRWTIDTEEDLGMARAVYKELYMEGGVFLTADILRLIKEHPEIALMNSGVKRSAMYERK
ncbi:MAG: glycosyltransferase family protein [Candidatus ainarchaeum sp.]|nr:glycosyltransferase family protein [Candidatus ainarchaeum sp.]